MNNKKPQTNNHTIVGKNLNISFSTPVLEVKVVEPVKLSDRNAVTGGNIKRQTVVVMIFNPCGKSV
jgi:hypothetical protein